MGKKFIPVNNFYPFDIPRDKWLEDNESLVTVTMPVQVNTEGDAVVEESFPDLIITLEERGARRGEEYIIHMRATPQGHYIIGFSTFTTYLSREDII